MKKEDYDKIKQNKKLKNNNKKKEKMKLLI